MKKTLLVLTCILIACPAFSERPDSTRQQPSVSGAVTVTNNGIALIPTFTLGKPAALFDVAVRKGRFSFEPQLTFALEGAKPWYFVFWLRYKAIQTRRFSMGVGFHPSVVFVNPAPAINGIPTENLTAVRYFVGELTPTYRLSGRVSVGVYYLHAYGLSGGATNTNFVSLTSTFAKMPLGSSLHLSVTPQLYLVAIDGRKGYYATSAFTVGKPKLPFTISTVVNKKIQSDIPSDDLIWNMSVTYLY